MNQRIPESQKSPAFFLVEKHSNFSLIKVTSLLWNLARFRVSTVWILRFGVTTRFPPLWPPKSKKNNFPNKTKLDFPGSAWNFWGRYFLFGRISGFHDLHEEFGQEGFHTNSNLVPSSKCRRRNVGNVDENQSSPFFWEGSEKCFNMFQMHCRSAGFSPLKS